MSPMSGRDPNLIPLDLDINERYKKSLLEAGISTVDEVVAYFDKNGELKSITGIGEAAEAEILEAIGTGGSEED